MNLPQRFGAASELAPPIVIGGEPYATMVRFKASAESDPFPGKEVVRGIIDGIQDLGDGLLGITCRRSRERFTYTSTWGGGSPDTEVDYYALVGGNVADTPEPLRFYWHTSASAVRGDMAGIRAVPMDMLLIGPPNASRGYLIDDVFPMAIAPDVVRYNGDEVGPTVSYHAINWLNLFLPQPDRSGANRNKRIDLSRDDNNFFTNTGIYRVDGANVATKLTRRIFLRPDDQEPDPSLYPAGAILPPDNYHIDPDHYLIHVNSNLVDDRLSALYYVAGYATADVAANDAFVLIAHETHLGYVDGGNDTTGFVMDTRQDESHAFQIFKSASQAHYGVGSIEWSFPIHGLTVALTWAVDAVTGIRAKIDPDGELIPFNITPTTFTGDLQQITVALVDGVVSFHAGANLIGVADLQLPEFAYGQLGARSWGDNAIKFIPPPGKHERLGAGDIFYQQLLSGGPYTWVQDYRLPSTAPITSVTSLGAQGAYSASGSPRRRNHYERVDISGVGYLRVYAETAPDNVRVQQAAIAGPPAAGPGRPPRTGSAVTNLATTDGGNEASLDVGENRANWHDQLVIVGTMADFPFNAGDPFVVHRGAVIDPRQPYTLEFDVRGDAAHTWEAVPLNQFISRPVEGVFLLRQGFVDTFTLNDIDGVSAKMCFRINATFITHHANLDARTINEQAAAIEAMDEMSFETVLTGTPISITGHMNARAITKLGQTCYGCIGNSTGLSLGTSREHWGAIAAAAAFGGLTLPQPWKDTSTGAPGYIILDQSVAGAEVRNHPSDYSVEISCGDPPCGGYTSNSHHEASRMIYLWPWSEYPPQNSFSGIPANCFGSMPPTFTENGLWGPTQFRFTGIPIQIPPEITRAPQGSVVVSAYLDVKFGGVKSWAWDTVIAGYYPRNSASGGSAAFYTAKTSIQQYINGTLVSDFRGADVAGGPLQYGIDIEGPLSEAENQLAVETAAIGFNLIGRRRNSRSVFFDLTFARNVSLMDPAHPGYNAAVEEARAFSRDTVIEGSWTTYGTGIVLGTEIRADRWTSVDCTAAIQGLFAAKTDEVTDLQLMPTIGGIDLGATPGSMAGYLKGLDPTATINWSNPSIDHHSYSIVAWGQRTEAAILETGALHIMLRLADGTLDEFTVAHLPRRRM